MLQAGLPQSLDGAVYVSFSSVLEIGMVHQAAEQ
jgi:hypothetical protein